MNHKFLSILILFLISSFMVKPVLADAIVSPYNTPYQHKNYENYSIMHINKEGKVLSTLNPIFFGKRTLIKGNLSEGLIAFRLNKKWGYVNKSCEFVIQPQFDDAGTFTEGLAPVKADGKWGYIDKTGKFVINPQFDRAYNFENGKAEVWKKPSNTYSRKNSWPFLNH